VRTGDTVRHEPSGEEWLVAYVEGTDLVPCGWPLTFAKVSDCKLVTACSDEESTALLNRMADMRDGGDVRCRYARRKLGILE
jgi:hypothetical protein